jgi:hypothetical protein
MYRALEERAVAVLLRWRRRTADGLMNGNPAFFETMVSK